MKVIAKASLISILLLGGCTAMAEEPQETEATDVVTAYGKVESVDDGNVVISYESEEDSKVVTESVPSSVMVLKDSSSLHTKDLKEDDQVSVSFTNGKMKVIQVLSDDSKTAAGSENSKQ